MTKEEHRAHLLAQINEMNAELERIKPPHGLWWRNLLRTKTEADIERLAFLIERHPDTPHLPVKKREAEIILWALRLAEEQLPPGMQQKGKVPGADPQWP